MIIATHNSSVNLAYTQDAVHDICFNWAYVICTKKSLNKLAPHNVTKERRSPFSYLLVQNHLMVYDDSVFLFWIWIVNSFERRTKSTSLQLSLHWSTFPFSIFWEVQFWHTQKLCSNMASNEMWKFVVFVHSCKPITTW